MRPEDFSTIQRSINSIRASGISDKLLKMQQVVRQMESQGVFAQIQAATREYANMVDTAQKLSLVLESATRTFTQILSGIKLPDFDEWRQVEGEAIEILTQRGWWPLPHWPLRLLRSVVQLKKDGHLRRLDSFICDAYEVDRGKPLRRALESWGDLPEFKIRRKIFEDGLWAYRKKKYGLAVNAWLPQVEGVLRELAARQGFGPQSWKRSATDLKASQPDYMEAFTDAFFGAFHSLYHTSPGNRAPERANFPFNRHAILHGAALDFSRRAYALRIFLMLDTLHYLIVKAEKSGQTAA